MAQHRRARRSRVWSVAAAVGIATAVTVGGAGQASAHNHLFNPSGVCNTNAGPGNADAATNPAGHTPGNRDLRLVNGAVGQGDDHCTQGR